MARILSCYRLKKPVEIETGDRRKTRSVSLTGFPQAFWRKPIPLPVQQVCRQEDLLLFLGIPEEWLALEQGLFQILRAAMEETDSDWFYLEPALQRRLCAERAGQCFFEDYGILGKAGNLIEYQSAYFEENCSRRQRLVVYLEAEILEAALEILLQLARGRNELTLLFAKEEEVLEASDILEELEDELEYEYGLIPCTGWTAARFLEEERRRREPLWVCDFTAERSLLTGLLDGRLQGEIHYLDGMPTPEKEKYGAKRSSPHFFYRSIAEKWRFCPAEGEQIIDTPDKSGYNTIVKWEKYRRILDRKGMRHGRKEKHIDL